MEVPWAEAWKGFSELLPLFLSILIYSVWLPYTQKNTWLSGGYQLITGKDGFPLRKKKMRGKKKCVFLPLCVCVCLPLRLHISVLWEFVLAYFQVGHH